MSKRTRTRPSVPYLGKFWKANQKVINRACAQIGQAEDSRVLDQLQNSRLKVHTGYTERKISASFTIERKDL